MIYVEFYHSTQNISNKGRNRETNCLNTRLFIPTQLYGKKREAANSRYKYTLQTTMKYKYTTIFIYNNITKQTYRQKYRF